MATFRTRLALLALLALAVRLLAAYWNRGYPVVGDALTYHVEGGYLAHGQGFRRVFEDVRTAEHPPAHIVVVAFLDLLGAHSTGAQKAGLGLVGTGTVVLTGLLGRRLASPRVGLVAAAIAAVYPMLWLPDAALMSETTSTFCVVLTLLAATSLAERRTVPAAVGLGAAIGLTTLARGEALGLLVVLLLPLVLLVARRDLRRAAVLLAVGAAAFAVVLAPWAIRNASVFSRPVLVSTNGDGVWVGANCGPTYYGSLIGSWVFACYGRTPPGDEAAQSVVYRKRGLRYARHHAGRLPLVLLAREGRLLDVYRPWTQGVFLAGAEGRKATGSRAGLAMYWLLLPLGLAGVVLLWRRRRDGARLVVLLAPVVLVVVVGALVYGSTRFRTSAEPSLVIAAAVSLDALARRLSPGDRTVPGAS